MISSECKLSDFFSAVKDRDYFDVIYLADREATEAERMLLKPQASVSTRNRCGEGYAQRLKQFITYLRYGLKPKGIENDEFKLFQSAAPPRPVRWRM